MPNPPFVIRVRCASAGADAAADLRRLEEAGLRERQVLPRDDGWLVRGRCTIETVNAVMQALPHAQVRTFLGQTLEARTILLETVAELGSSIVTEELFVSMLERQGIEPPRTLLLLDDLVTLGWLDLEPSDGEIAVHIADVCRLNLEQAKAGAPLRWPAGDRPLLRLEWSKSGAGPVAVLRPASPGVIGKETPQPTTAPASIGAGESVILVHSKSRRLELSDGAIIDFGQAVEVWASLKKIIETRRKRPSEGWTQPPKKGHRDEIRRRVRDAGISLERVIETRTDERKGERWRLAARPAFGSTHTKPA